MRGGFMELVNIDPEGKEQLYKLASIGLCSNVPGQVITSVMCNLPKEGEASFESHTAESTNQFESLKRRAATVSEELNKIDGHLGARSFQKNPVGAKHRSSQCTAQDGGRFNALRVSLDAAPRRAHANAWKS